jgi:acetoin:2,6-dichlorophenolindophenol oxidoreductase subunit alpha
MKLSADDLLKLYRLMVFDRRYEEKQKMWVESGVLKTGFYHLSVGQEATNIGPIFCLRPDDLLMPTHRGFGKMWAKGISLKELTAGMMCKRTGFGKGRSGVTHSGDLRHGLLARPGVLGAAIALSVGAALALKLQKKDQIVLCFFGDGVANLGDFHEGLNLAGAMKLPIVFICENNLYGMTTPAGKAMAIQDISSRAAGYGFPGLTVDGNDILAVVEASQEAVQRARSGNGPTLIECKTYRWYGHSPADPETYRTKEEVESWKKLCPISRFEKHLKKMGILKEKMIQDCIAEADREIEESLEYAKSCPDPEPSDIYLGIMTP